MSTFRLDRASGALLDADGRRFDPVAREWRRTAGPSDTSTCDTVDVVAAAAWLQRDSGQALRVPVGVIGPRDASPAQLSAALEVGERLSRCGFAVICGGRHGVMQAVCEGVARNGGISIGLLPDADPALANPYVSIALATGIGEARNALVARAAFCLVAIGDSYGTLSEVALGLQFGKSVIGLEGAACVEGVRHVASPRAAVERVAALALNL
jgi:uncharacterized protein (TIGR00725 family)